MNFIRRFLPYLICGAALVAPVPALADWGIVDQLNLSPFVPLILDAMMTIASGGYDFFVGNGTGVIYVLVWGFLVFTICLYLVKLYLPQNWTGLLGFSGGGEMFDGKATSETIIYNVLKPCLRGIIAALVLLQIRPTMLTEVLVNPFLQFGALYTHSITETINQTGANAPKVECPEAIVQKEWISKSSCEFLIQPVYDLSVANNQIIKRGFQYITKGLGGLMTIIPHGNHPFLNLITGIILVTTFFSSNLFMALLIIEAIFKFGMALVLYPFYVLSYVVKPNDKWLDIWPAFDGITKELKNLVVTMIMCSFMLCVNVAIIRALFTWNSSIFVVTAGGSATSNLPTIANTSNGFGEHSILWLSSILTFYLMFKLYDMTQEQLVSYVGGRGQLYDKAIGDTKTAWGVIKDAGKKIGTIAGWIKK